MSNLQVFTGLPQELKDKICLLSGHFKLRYDNQKRKQILVAQLNLQTQEWKEFIELLNLCIKTRKQNYLGTYYSSDYLMLLMLRLGGFAYTH